MTRRSLRQTTNIFWRGVTTSADTITKSTTITDWQLTRHIVKPRHDCAGNGPLCVSACSQKQSRTVLCVGSRHGYRTNKVCREFSRQPNRGRWSIKNNQRQMTSPSKMEHIKHLCGCRLSEALSLFCIFFTHNYTEHTNNNFIRILIWWSSQTRWENL